MDKVIDELAQALAVHRAGDLDRAMQLYRRILNREARNPDALRLLGALQLQRGRLDEAERLLSAAIEVAPKVADAHYLLGRVFLSRRMPGQAVERFEACLERDGGHEAALVASSIALHEQGNDEAALTHLQKATAINPRSFDAWHHQAVILGALGRLADALEARQKSLSIRPDFADGLRALGELLLQLERPTDALGAFHRMLALKPDRAEGWHGIGRVFLMLRRYVEAAGAFDKARAMRPDYAEAWLGRGYACAGLVELAEAEAAFRKALEIEPRLTAAAISLGSLLSELRRPDEAIAVFDQALALNPSTALYIGRAGVRYSSGDREGFVSDIERCLELSPDSAIGRWGLALRGTVPVVAGLDHDPAAVRRNLAQNLAELDQWHGAERSGEIDAVGSNLFYLAYQEEDNREIMSTCGALCCRLMKQWQDKQSFSSSKAKPSSLLKVGIVSAHIYNHSVWGAIVKGWLSQFDRRRIEPHVIHLGQRQDGETDWARSRAASFESGSKDIRGWVDAILSKELDVIIYPEIGMEHLPIQLASLRLAPLQAVSWGHPETTGLATIDCYLSAAAFEPPDAQRHYTERLISLPNLGCYFEPLSVAGSAPDLELLGIRRGHPLLLCPGAPFKYAPQFDIALADTARRLGECQLVFFDFPSFRHACASLRHRLEASFSRAGLRFADYGVFIPLQEPSAFFGLMTIADVFLDTIGFSGFNTAMQAVECGLPIVTKDGRFLRGRLASGILKQMGMADLVANTVEDYVELAVKLASDGQARNDYQNLMGKNRGVLYRDASSVRALEDFLVESIGRG